MATILPTSTCPRCRRMPGSTIPVIFAPAVVPAYRGMIVEVPLHLGAMAPPPHADDLRDALADFYADARLVKVHGSAPVGELLLETDAEATDGLELFVFANEGGWNTRASSRGWTISARAPAVPPSRTSTSCAVSEDRRFALGLCLKIRQASRSSIQAGDSDFDDPNRAIARIVQILGTLLGTRASTTRKTCDADRRNSQHRAPAGEKDRSDHQALQAR